MFRGKDKKPFDLQDASNRLRGFFLDTQLPDANDIAVLMGCPAISDEVLEREEEESDKRLARIGRLVPLVYAHATSAAQGTVAHQRQTVEHADSIPDEVWNANRKMMEKMALAVTIATISQLVDMEIITLPKKRGRR